MMMHRLLSPLAATLLLSALAGCGSGDKAELEKLDAELSAKKPKDPAVADALESPILVDPNLATQSNDHAIRPSNQPNPGAVPSGAAPDLAANAQQTPAAIATEQARIHQESFAGCQLAVQYSAGFAASAPADLPLHPKGQLSEAAGSNADKCRLRAITYTVAATPDEMKAYYVDLARDGGYTAGQKQSGKELLVSGRRASDGGAFYAIIKPAGAGAEVDLVANNGR